MGEFRAKMGKFGAKWTNLRLNGQIYAADEHRAYLGPKQANFGPNWPNLGGKRAHLGLKWANLGLTWANLGQNGQI